MEPTPPELGAATGSPPGLVVAGREELLYLLGEAAEVEHAACCSYLYAAFSLRAEPGAGLTAAQAPAVAGWRRAISQIALQEMIHLALVNNLLAALGGAPRLGRHNLPQRSPYAPEIRLTLAPFSEPTLRRFLYIERPEGMDISSMAGQLDHDRPPPPTLTGPLVLPAPQAFSSIGELYRGIERGLRGLVDRYGEGRVFVGSPKAQASTRYFRVPERMPELIPVTGLASAAQAIQTIVEEGEGARGSGSAPSWPRPPGGSWPCWPTRCSPRPSSTAAGGWRWPPPSASLVPSCSANSPDRHDGRRHRWFEGGSDWAAGPDHGAPRPHRDPAAQRGRPAPIAGALTAQSLPVGL